jgi:hypothetical protein
MTNEEYIEEILYRAHDLGIAEELYNRIPKNVDPLNLCDAYFSEMMKILDEKKLH